MNNYTILAGFLCDPTVAVHQNSSQLFTETLVMPSIIIALSITATLGNALILVALHKESSLNPPSKLFLRCLACSDLCVGVLVQPMAAVSLLSAVYHRWNLCQIVELQWYSFSILLVTFSLAILTAISVDRLLALLLSIRYRQVVTMKRARLLIALFLLLSIVNCGLQHIDRSAFNLFSAVTWFLCLITSIYCYVRIFLALRNLIQVHVSPQEQQNGISPLNVSQYKRTVSTALWIFAALIICYAPFGLLLIVNATLPELSGSLADLYFFFAVTLVYLNSSLNPVLYFWKIREVRDAVKEILRNLGFKLCGN